MNDLEGYNGIDFRKGYSLQSNMNKSLFLGVLLFCIFLQSCIQRKLIDNEDSQAVNNHGFICLYNFDSMNNEDWKCLDFYSIQELNTILKNEDSSYSAVQISSDLPIFLDSSKFPMNLTRYRNLEYFYCVSKHAINLDSRWSVFKKLVVVELVSQSCCTLSNDFAKFQGLKLISFMAFKDSNMIQCPQSKEQLKNIFYTSSAPCLSVSMYSLHLNKNDTCAN